MTYVLRGGGAPPLLSSASGFIYFLLTVGEIVHITQGAMFSPRWPIIKISVTCCIPEETASYRSMFFTARRSKCKQDLFIRTRRRKPRGLATYSAGISSSQNLKKLHNLVVPQLLPRFWVQNFARPRVHLVDAWGRFRRMRASVLLRLAPPSEIYCLRIPAASRSGFICASGNLSTIGTSRHLVDLDRQTSGWLTAGDRVVSGASPIS